jgi:hypothetical protein
MAKYSGASNRSANFANGTASATAETAVSRPPHSAASSVQPSASAGWPWRAIA